MCGIFGIVGAERSTTEVTALLERMAAALVRRGPDDWGTWQDPAARAGLGMTRLSILDVAGGHQPLGNEDGSIQIVFNGEIYNCRELQEELEAKGHRFATRTDTESIVHLYEEEGERCVERLDGMFAFALWDSRRRRLLLARDPLGKKPLYYAQLGTEMIFGSELKALRLHPRLSDTLDLESVNTYLALGYTIAPRTILRDVRQVPPGTALVFEDSTLRQRRYWEPSPGRDPAAPGPDPDSVSEEEYVEQFQELIEQAVHKRLLSDVPLGAFLSGGIDSSTVVAAMQRLTPEQVHTFCLGFDERTYGEQTYAATVASHLGTAHRELTMPLSNVVEDLPTILWHLDEPMADTSVLPQYYLSRFTRQHVTVALSGDGGDEVLAGYVTYLANRMRPWYRLVPGPLRRGVIAPVVRRLPPSYHKVGFDYMARRFVEGAELEPDAAHYWWRVLFTDDERRRILAPEARRLLGDHAPFDDYLAAAPKRDEFAGNDRFLYLDLSTYLPNDILVKVDRTSMGNSLEARAPFLDRRVVEFLLSVPPSLKLRGMTRKYLLRRATQGTLPKHIIARRKQGFSAPVAVWFRDMLGATLHDTVLAQPLPWFDAAAVRAMADEHLAGRADHGYKLWALVVLHQWHEQSRRALATIPDRPATEPKAAPVNN